jgi:hypothetical protein
MSLTSYRAAPSRVMNASSFYAPLFANATVFVTV